MTALEDAMGVGIDPPTILEARHYTRQLGWEERFDLAVEVSRVGNINTSCYCPQDVARYLMQQHGVGIDLHGSRLHVDVDRLNEWIESVVGDVAFAAAIGRAVNPSDPFFSQLDSLRAVFVRRLNQYQDTLTEQGAAAAEVPIRGGVDPGASR